MFSPRPQSAQILNGATITTAAPAAATDGTLCRGTSWAIVTLQSQAATSASFVVWTYSVFSGSWAVRKDLGVQGTVTVTTATDGGVDRIWVFLGRGVDQIDIQLSAITGAAGAGCDGWVEFSDEAPYS